MTSTSRGLLKGLGVVVFVLILFIFTAPASLVSEQVAEQQNVVQLSGYQGRLMSGQVEQIFVKGLNYQQLSWKANAFGLLQGALKADINLDDPKANLNVAIDLRDQQNWSFEALNGQLLVAPLANLSPIMKRFGLAGEIDFAEVGITMTEQKFTSAQGTVSWESGYIRVSNMNFPLGTILANVSTRGDSLLLSYSGSGALLPGGDITLSPVGEYEMTLNIDPAGLPADAAWLSRMGKLQDNGQVQFTMKGKVRL